MAANVANRALTNEQKKKKWPLEWALREAYVPYLASPPGSRARRAHEKTMYEALVRLTKAVIVHKYGSSSRIDYATLPHDIASSLMVTIVMREKEVWSWTNLMKKVVRDAVSNHLRREYYHGMSFVELDSGEGDADFDGSDSDESVASRFEFDSSIKTEDLIYVKQMLDQCATGLCRLLRDQLTLSQHVIFKLALHEVVNKKKHYLADMLPMQHFYRYNFYVSFITMELAPVLSSKYLYKLMYH